MNNQAKQKIRTIVANYIVLDPQEFASFCKEQKEWRKKEANAFASSTSDVVERKIFEIPDTLYSMLKIRLSDEDMDWFRTKEGARWFAKSFKDFRSSEKI